MFGTFATIKSNFRLRPRDVSIDNLAFRLHYRATTLILLAASVLVCSRQYVGEHIACVTETRAVPQHVMNTFCFFTATFTLGPRLNDTSRDLAHPGVGPMPLADVEEPVRRHNYYQWVPFVLFGQALAFYLPHYIWKRKEAGRLAALTSGLRYAAYSITDSSGLTAPDGRPLPTAAASRLHLAHIRRAFLERLHVLSSWAFWLVFCELLNAVNLAAQLYLTDRFLGGCFLALGPRALRNADVLDEVFPKVTKCTFHKYGPTGTMQTHDALCVMALNIVNEKIYVFLWFWYAGMCVATLMALAWRAITQCLHSRSALFNRRVFPGTWGARIAVTDEYHFSDWLFLSYLAANVDGPVFGGLFHALAEDMYEQERPQDDKAVLLDVQEPLYAHVERKDK